MDDIVDAVRRSLGGEAQPTFDERVERQAAFLRDAIAAGDLDNPHFAVGLELEVYAVDGAGRLATLPVDVFDGDGPNKELGKHNAELNTAPNRFDAEGLASQARKIDEAVDRGREAVADYDRDLILDAMWTIPPAEGSAAYLGSVTEYDGVRIADNMRPNARYCAIDNEIVDRAGGSVSVEIPHATITAPTILLESLATSIQPHLQVSSTEAFPTYYRTGIRTLGPVLALSTNSPLFPPDVYDDVDPHRVLDDAHHECRVHVFEQAINTTEPGKVRFPEELERTTDVVDFLVADELRSPFLREWVDGPDPAIDDYADNYWELDHKRSTYWRWLRAVVGGDPVGDGDERSIRIEYRPIPTQPSVPDIVGMQALTVGLLRGLVTAEHPLVDLSWQRAHDSFYAAVEDGIEADLHWTTADGEHTTDSETIFAEVFEYARRGLREAGLRSRAIDRYLRPIERRWDQRRTPSSWKLDQVRERIADGADFEEAVVEAQRTYVQHQSSGEPFVEW